MPFLFCSVYIAACKDGFWLKFRSHSSSAIFTVSNIYYKREKECTPAVRSKIKSNSSLQAVCDTPVARITGCVSSLRI